MLGGLGNLLGNLGAVSTGYQQAENNRLIQALHQLQLQQAKEAQQTQAGLFNALKNMPQQLPLQPPAQVPPAQAGAPPQPNFGGTLGGPQSYQPGQISAQPLPPSPQFSAVPQGIGAGARAGTGMDFSGGERPDPLPEMTSFAQAGGTSFGGPPTDTSLPSGIGKSAMAGTPAPPPPDPGQIDYTSMPQQTAGTATPQQMAMANYLVRQGYSPAAAAGMVGSMTGESGRSLDPLALNAGQIGMGQWTGARRDALLRQSDPFSRATQARFLTDELRGSEAATGQRMMTETDPVQAARDFTLGFERPSAAAAASSMPQRTAAAQAVYKGLTGQSSVGQAYADMNSSMSPQDHGAGVQGARAMLANYPQMPRVLPQLDLRQVAQTIDQANPGVSDTVKGAILLKLYPMLNEQAKEQTAEQWKVYTAQVEQYKEGEHEREFGETKDIERARLTEPKFGTPEDFEITGADGQKRTVSAFPDERTGRLIDPTTRQPIPFKQGDQVRRVPLTEQQPKGWTLYTDPQSGKTYRVNPNTGEAVQTDLPGGLVKTGTKAAAGAVEIGGSVEDAAQMIANYNSAPLSSWVLSKPWGQQVMSRVRQINPQYDATSYAAKLSGARAFAGGQLGNTLQSMNTVADHLTTLSELTQALQGTGSRTLNQLQNMIGTEFGWTGALNFESAKTIVGDEIAKAVIGGRTAEGDRMEIQRQLNAANTPEQLAGVIQTFEKLVAGQLSSLRRRWVGLGRRAEDFDEQLSEEAQTLIGSHVRRDGAGKPETAPKSGGGPEVDVSSFTESNIAEMSRDDLEELLNPEHARLLSGQQRIWIGKRLQQLGVR